MSISESLGDTLQALIVGDGKFPIVRVPRGFHGVTGQIVLPDTADVFLMVTSCDRNYELQVDGDLRAQPQITNLNSLLPNGHYELTTNLNTRLPDVFMIAVHWSDEAKAAGKGRGVLIVKDVSMLEEPSRFDVSIGDASVVLNSEA